MSIFGAAIFCVGAKGMPVSGNINIPIGITVFRILLVPVLAVFLSLGMLAEALAVFVVAGISDALDGFIAKRFGQTTELGRILDPVADKLLLVTSFVMLTVKGWMPFYLCALVVARDVLIIAVFLAFRNSERKLELPPSIASKINTVLQVITVVLAMYFARPAPCFGAPDASFMSMVFALTAFLRFTAGWIIL